MKSVQHQANAAGPAKAPAAGGGLAKSKRGRTAVEGVRAWLRRRCGALWLTALVLAVGATQIRSLEQEYFNDESTAVVMAGHLLDGNLPYVQLFDNKPPMIFLLLAGAMALFGESLLVVRAVGDFFLLLSAAAVFAIAQRRAGPAAAGLGALLLIAIHAKGPGTPTMAALPAMALALAALWLLLARRKRLWAVAAAGLLLSLATLTRTNLGLLALACAVWLGVAPLRPPLGVQWRAVPVFAAAGRVGADEVGRILALRPTWLVVRAVPQAGVVVPHYFDDRNAALLRRLLANGYRVFHDRGWAGQGFRVYQLREGRGRPA